MSEERKLKVVTEDQIRGLRVLPAEEELRAADTSGIDYSCGSCGRVLIVDDPEAGMIAMKALVLRCSCGALNTDR